jgi:hypothetical protein
MRSSIFIVSVFGVLAFISADVGAATVKIGGTHSRSEIKNTCAAVGGDYSGGKSGYGCSKAGGGVVVCNMVSAEAIAPNAAPNKVGSLARAAWSGPNERARFASVSHDRNDSRIVAAWIGHLKSRMSNLKGSGTAHQALAIIAASVIDPAPACAFPNACLSATGRTSVRRDG